MMNDAMTMTHTLKYSLKIKSSTYMSLGMRLVQVQEMVWPKYANVHTLFDLWSLHFFPFLRRRPSVDLPQCQRMYIFWAQSRYQRQSQEVKSQKPSHSLLQAEPVLKKRHFPKYWKVSLLKELEIKLFQQTYWIEWWVFQWVAIGCALVFAQP